MTTDYSKFSNIRVPGPPPLTPLELAAAKLGRTTIYSYYECLPALRRMVKEGIALDIAVKSIENMCPAFLLSPDAASHLVIQLLEKSAD